MHLYENGLLSVEGDPASATLHPGIMVMKDAIEARLALSRPESMIVRKDMPIIDLSDEMTPKALSELWCSKRPT